MIGNRLFRVCCRSCIKAVRKDPGKFLAELDAAVIKEQAKHYPLSTCIVRDKSKLGSMGDPVQRVVGNRLVQFCCKGCEPAFNEDPSKLIASLDAAWAEHHREHGTVNGSPMNSSYLINTVTALLTDSSLSRGSPTIPPSVARHWPRSSPLAGRKNRANAISSAASFCLEYRDRV